MKMANGVMVLALAAACVAGCSREEEARPAYVPGVDGVSGSVITGAPDMTILEDQKPRGARPAAAPAPAPAPTPTPAATNPAPAEPATPEGGATEGENTAPQPAPTGDIPVPRAD